jgi:hypothetical protein
MFFPRIKSAMPPPGGEEWNAARRGLVRPRKDIVNPEEVLPERLRLQHWISLTCYVEQIEPEALSLRPDLFGRVQEELAELNALDPLRTYVAVLSTLNTDLGKIAGSESSDAATE